MPRRGCGDRVSDGLYLCVGTSAMGRPIEDFILDPARAWEGGVLRAPMLAERKVTEDEINCLTQGRVKLGDTVNDALMWVGAEFYPFASDFIEEARLHGISKRIPSDFPVEQLTPFLSRLVLIHPKGIPEFAYELPISKMCRKPEKQHQCTFDLWGLSALQHVPEKHDVDGGKASLSETARVTIPCGAIYTVPRPRELSDSPSYSAAAFAAFYITHFDYVNSERKAPRELAERYQSCGWDFRAVEG